MRVKIFLMLIINLCLLIILAYVLEFAGIVNYFSTIRTRITGSIKPELAQRIDDPNLIEKAENDKLYAALEMQAADLKTKETELNKKAEVLAQTEKELDAERKQIENTRTRIEAEEQEKKDYQKQIEDLAFKFGNMPPERSVERIIGLKDDQLIIAVLKQMDKNAEAAGTSSIVPYLYSLMPKEDASRLMKKSTVQP